MFTSPYIVFTEKKSSQQQKLPGSIGQWWAGELPFCLRNLLPRKSSGEFGLRKKKEDKQIQTATEAIIVRNNNKNNMCINFTCGSIFSINKNTLSLTTLGSIFLLCTSFVWCQKLLSIAVERNPDSPKSDSDCDVSFFLSVFLSCFLSCFLYLIWYDLVLSDKIWSYLILPYHIASYLILSSLILSYLILSLWSHIYIYIILYLFLLFKTPISLTPSPNCFRKKSSRKEVARHFI